MWVSCWALVWALDSERSSNLCQGSVQTITFCNWSTSLSFWHLTLQICVGISWSNAFGILWFCLVLNFSCSPLIICLIRCYFIICYLNGVMLKWRLVISTVNWKEGTSLINQYFETWKQWVWKQCLWHSSHLMKTFYTYKYEHFCVVL